jgi:hypothetical protein
LRIETPVGTSENVIEFRSVLDRIGGPPAESGSLELNHPRHQLGGRRRRGPREQGNELVASDTKDLIDRAQGRAQSGTESHDGIVAGGMTLEVVDPLESIEVDRHKTGWLSSLLSLCDCRSPGVVQGPAVTRSREGVGQGRLLQPQSELFVRRGDNGLKDVVEKNRIAGAENLGAENLGTDHLPEVSEPQGQYRQ